MPRSAGFLETTVNVLKGHVYGASLTGVVGPVTVYDGDTDSSPVLCRLRDNKRTFFWTPEGEGERKLLFAGWPDQRAVAVTVVDMGKAAITSVPIAVA